MTYRSGRRRHFIPTSSGGFIRFGCERQSGLGKLLFQFRCSGNTTGRNKRFKVAGQSGVAIG